MADTQINHSDSLKYWESISADVNGMLGGFPYISKVDLQGSRNFLVKLGIGGKAGRKCKRVVDCGAGIGRITEGLLLDIADTVDIVEPIAKFSSPLDGKSGIAQIFNVGLEDWTPSPTPEDAYSLIWNQWCLGHLTDAQLVVYLKRCAEALEEGGWVVVKENLSTSEGDLFDEVDSSVTRTNEKFRDIFAEAGLEVKRTELQKGLPKQLYPVRIYALQPKVPS